MKWISVEDEMPKNRDVVLIGRDDNPYVYQAEYFEQRGFFICDQPFDPSHWMPLPDPPKKEKK